MPIPPLPFLPTRALVIASILLFAAAVIGTMLIGPYNRLSGRGEAKLPMNSLGDRPILQVELARSEDDIRAVLITGDSRANLHDATIGNRLDTFLFIPAYAGFLFTIGVLLTRADPRRASLLSLLALVVVPIIALGDWTENYGIAGTIDHIAQTGAPQAGDALRISSPSLVKWTLLALTLLAYGGIALRISKAWSIPLGILLLGVGLSLSITLVNYLLERFS
jgi:hypothetical protein